LKLQNHTIKERKHLNSFVEKKDLKISKVTTRKKLNIL